VLPLFIALAGAAVAVFSILRIRALSGETLSKWRLRAERVTLMAAALCALAIAASSAVNAILLHQNRAHPPGSFYAVNGHRMRLDCTGSGSPTLILDAGLGNDGLIWSGVQPVLSRTTQVCSYDRAGFGWSDPMPAPRDADHIASELHALLDAAGIRGPLVLLGHSIAGIYIRDYATRYPADVAGLIFVDASTPLQNRDPAIAAVDGNGPPWYEIPLNEAMFAAGIPRLLSGCRWNHRGFDAYSAKLQGEDRCHEAFGGIAGERASFDLSGAETAHTGPYGALPILIFSQDPSATGPDPLAAEADRAWNRMQDDLKNLSTRSRRIIARGSGHYIQIQRPELVENEVSLFIGQIRGDALRPPSYGSTTVE